jgi:hypothetical protein
LGRPTALRILVVAGLAACDGSPTETVTVGPVYGGVAVTFTASNPSSGDGTWGGSDVAVTTYHVPGDTAQTWVDALDLVGTPQRKLQVQFTSGTGLPRAVFYSWGPTTEALVCFAAECTGVSIDRSAKVITFANTQVGNGTPLGASLKVSTLNGSLTYP